MVSLGALWLPVLLSAVLVFVTSFLVHMVLRYHNSDYKPLPNEEAVRAAIRSGNPAPAQYIIPYCADPKEMQSPEKQKKFIEEHGSSLLSEKFYDWLVEENAKTILPLINGTKRVVKSPKTAY